MSFSTVTLVVLVLLLPADPLTILVLFLLFSTLKVTVHVQRTMSTRTPSTASTAPAPITRAPTPPDAPTPEASDPELSTPEALSPKASTSEASTMKTVDIKTPDIKTSTKKQSKSPTKNTAKSPTSSPRPLANDPGTGTPLYLLATGFAAGIFICLQLILPYRIFKDIQSSSPGARLHICMVERITLPSYQSMETPITSPSLSTTSSVTQVITVIHHPSCTIEKAIPVSLYCSSTASGDAPITTGP